MAYVSIVPSGPSLSVKAPPGLGTQSRRCFPIGEITWTNYARSQSEVLRRKKVGNGKRFVRSTFDWAVCSEPLASAADAGLWGLNGGIRGFRKRGVRGLARMCARVNVRTMHIEF